MWGSICSWLGIQYASRNLLPKSQAPGPWDVTVTNTEGDMHGLVYQEIWDKNRRLILELVGMEREGRYWISRARMESLRGFLVYIYRTYRDINPYLKGVHLTLES